MKLMTARTTKVDNSARAAKKATGRLSQPLRVKSILVPIDFSSSSAKALDYAVAFACQFEATLTVLHVVEPAATPNFAATIPLSMEDDQVMTAAKSKLAGVIKAAGIPRGAVEKLLVRFGRSFHEITDAARTLKVDLIIISTHGYKGLQHVLLGSTTERVVRQASCPVLVVRENGHEILAP